VLPVARLAVLALVIAQPVRAALVLPSDFEPSRVWTFHRCETYGLIGVSACVDGTAYYGQNTTTGLFGVTYDFWSVLLGTLPDDGSFVTSRMVGFSFVGADALGVPQIVTIGSVLNPFAPAITSGQFFSSALTATSPLQSTLAFFRGVAGSQPCCTDDRFGPVSVTATPEPSALLLVGSGLAALGAARRRRHRREAQSRR
jgi:hypothetical protein